MEAGGLPGGVVSFLLTDIEGSTRLWERAPAAACAGGGVRRLQPGRSNTRSRHR
jgi:hypothetical protein